MFIEPDQINQINRNLLNINILIEYIETHNYRYLKSILLINK